MTRLTNRAVLLPGVEGGTFNAKLRSGTAAFASFRIVHGIAMSSPGVLCDGNPSHGQPLNAAAGGLPARSVDLEIDKGGDADRIAAARNPNGRGRAVLATETGHPSGPSQQRTKPSEAAMSHLEPTNHWVKHTSSIPANFGEEIKLFVREYSDGSGGTPKPVLMLHGRSVPALPGFDLVLPPPGGSPHPDTSYSWAQALADKGYDVYIMDLQGSGLSPRPRMDDPCNANPAQRGLLKTNPGTGHCSATASYPSQLGNSKSEWDELGTVVTFIRNRCANEQVSFIGWSAAAFVMGPYTLQHPGDVARLFLLAPMFPPNGRWSTDPAAAFAPPPGTGLPTKAVSDPAAAFGFPMNLTSKAGLQAGISDATLADHVWRAIMDSDSTGKKWGGATAGAPEGVMRWRNSYWWGWNRSTAPHGPTLGSTVPVCIVYGDQDRTANTPEELGPVLHFSVPKLYQAIPGADKLMFRVEGWDHNPVWERKANQLLQHMCVKWLEDKKVYGVQKGSWVRDLDGVLSPSE
ncbi:alpha/beta hydrolase [Streptomyces zhihengii]|uniref:alpha/beta hydrolase n=2 Tax=Streptomyces zhihengii TaxID=1818004 RepID=UPI0033AFC87A